MSGSGAERSGEAGFDEVTAEGVDGAGAWEAAVRVQRRRAATPARTRRCIGLTIQIGMSPAGRVIVRAGSASISRASAKPVDSTHAEPAGERSHQRG